VADTKELATGLNDSRYLEPFEVHVSQQMRVVKPGHARCRVPILEVIAAARVDGIDVGLALGLVENAFEQEPAMGVEVLDLFGRQTPGIKVSHLVPLPVHEVAQSMDSYVFPASMWPTRRYPCRPHGSIERDPEEIHDPLSAARTTLPDHPGRAPDPS
jgi:hypothetical protein